MNDSKALRPLRVKISALGTFVPPKLLTNADLEKMVDTTDDWILTRVGIHERHIVEKGVATSDLAVEAAKKALAQRGIAPSDLDAIIVGTVTPDMFFPSTACLVQDRIGAHGAWGFDLVAACSGFIYGLTTAAHFVMAGTHKKVLVIGADTMSRILDYTDRSTCILFGDAAGAMLIEPTDDENGFIGFLNEIDGSGGDYLKMPAGGSRMPSTKESVEQRMHFVKQDGAQVFKYAVRKMEELCTRLLERHNLTPKDVRLLIPHQANRRIILGVAERLGMDLDHVIINIDRFGNTTAATIPLAMQTALDEHRLQRESLVMLASVGAGFTVGACLLRWEM